MDSSTQSALQGCVTSLRSSMQLLESSIGILDSGVNDYPRLGKVLQTTRVCPDMRPEKLWPVLIESISSTSNLSPSTTSQQLNQPFSPKSNPKSTTSCPASRPTSTNSNDAKSHSYLKQSCKKVVWLSRRGVRRVLHHRDRDHNRDLAPAD